MKLILESTAEPLPFQINLQALHIKLSYYGIIFNKIDLISASGWFFPFNNTIFIMFVKFHFSFCHTYTAFKFYMVKPIHHV